MTPLFDARRVLRRRLLWVGFLTAALVGVVTWGIESERIDERVLDLAVKAARSISPRSMEAFAAGRLRPGELEAMVKEVAAERFGIVELYDAERRKLLEYVPPALDALEEELKRGAHVALGLEPAYSKRLVGGRFALVVAVPIARAGEAPVGYLEGVYLPDEETLGHIRHDVLRTVVLVVLAIVLATLAAYPVVLALQRQVLERTRSILRGNLEMLEVLGGAIAQRDSDTNVHNYRVTLYAVILGEAVGLAPREMRSLIAGAFLHDVGKIGISDSILLKPGRLTAEEFEIMKTHVTQGVDILRHSEWLQRARDVVAYHHEKFDGSGYVRGLAGEAIPLNARIFAVVDVFDALTSRRPYKAPMSPAASLQAMDRDRGTHFDPVLLATFSSLAHGAFARIGGADETSLRLMLAPVIERYFMAGAAA